MYNATYPIPYATTRGTFLIDFDAQALLTDLVCVAEVSEETLLNIFILTKHSESAKSSAYQQDIHLGDRR